MTGPTSAQWPSLGGAIDLLYAALDSGKDEEYDAYIERYADRLNVSDVETLRLYVEDEAFGISDTQGTMKRIGKLMGT